MGKKSRSKRIKLSSLDKKILDIEWRPIMIEGKPTKYEVSDSGLVIRRDHNILLQQTLDSDGYPQLTIFVDDKGYCRKIHRLVAEAFIPKEEGRDQINHKDGNKCNNHVSNLEWCTLQENVAHAWKTGLSTARNASTGAAHKYDPKIIHRICKLLEENKLSYDEISSKLDVPKGLISEIRCGHRWKYISSQYKIPPIPEFGGTHPIFTEEQIRKVCELLSEDKLPQQKIADIAGVSKAAVAGIKSRSIWTNISKDYNIPYTNCKRNKYISLYTDEQIHQVCKLLEEQKYSYVQIAEMTGVSYSVVTNVKYRTSWRTISSQYNI